MKLKWIKFIFSKSCLILLTILFIPSISHAGLQLKAGGMISDWSLTGVTVMDPKFTFGYLISANYSIRISDQLKIEPGLSYSYKKSNYYDTRSRGREGFSVNFLNLKLPLCYKIESSRSSLIFGPYLAYRIGKENHNSDYYAFFFSEQKTGFGFNIGLRYDLRNVSKIGRIFLELLFDLEFTPFKSQAPDIWGDLTDYGYLSRNISISIGIEF